MKDRSYMLPALALVAAMSLAACNRDDVTNRSAAPSNQDQTAQNTAPNAAPGAPSDQTGEAGGRAVDDAAVTAKVKAALLAADGIKGTDISVETIQGNVILTGKVENTQQARRAGDIAMNVDGVRAVDNRLQASSS